MRNTFTPASSKAASISRERDAGPMVATIFVLRMTYPETSDNGQTPVAVLSDGEDF
jgi:hypothetical protein